MLVSLDFFKSIIGKIIDDVKRMKIDIDELQPKINGSPGQIVGFDTNGKIIATEESDPTVPDWAKQPQKPAYTAQEVGAIPATTAIPSTAADVNAEPSGAVSQHNVSDASHSDIRLLISGLTDRLNALADSDDTTLDQLSEVVEYIKANRELIASITTDKVSVADIVDNLTTNVANKPLSAAQGVVIKTLIDALRNDKLDASELTNAVNTALAQAKASGEFDGADGRPGENGTDGYSPTANVTQNDNGATITITDKNGTTTATLTNGKDGAPGQDGTHGDPGKDGITPTIGDNGNWYLGETDTNKPSRGEIGPAGADGKSAYKYAQDGGYTGTETEFAEKLAQEQLVGTTDELTPTQVYNAVSAGIPVKVQSVNGTYGLLSFTAFNVAESLNVIVSQTIVYHNGVYILAELAGNKSGGTWAEMFTTLAQKADIPTTLPNPNALTFTGAVTGSYNGSAAVTVNIPSAVTDDHINSLIDAKLGVIENGTY